MPGHLIYRLVVAVSLPVATAAVTLAGLNLPKDFWSDRPLSLYCAVGVVTLATIGQLFRYARPSGPIRKYEQNIRAIITAGLVEASTNMNIPFDRIGIHFFKIGGGLKKRLVNVGALRLSQHPNMIAPLWTKGKGVIGMSWETNDFVAIDWEAYFVYWEGRGRTSFQQQSKGDRFDLSWGEFQLTRGYKRIAASPIRNSDGSAIGCVSIDSPATLEQISNDAARQTLHNMAVALGALGRPPIGWTDGRVQ